MNRTPVAVASDNIKSVGWENGTLEIEFVNGQVYQYIDTPANFAEQMVHPSQGATPGMFFNLFVKERYAYKRVEPEPKPEPTPAKLSPHWLAQFDERQQKTIQFARLYAADFGHGADGHNNMMVIAKLAALLDEMQSV